MKSNNTHFNVLASFAYLYKDKSFRDLFFSLHREGTINGMIDSGAFTLFNAKENREWLTLDNYCRFLEEYADDCEKYVMLDKVGDDKQSKINYETMVKRGFKPMFVLTMFDNDLSYFRDTMNVNNHCCVAGGVTTKGNWMTKRFQQAYKASDKKALIHGLGYVTFPKMLQLPLNSVDSSSWIIGAQKFGLLAWFEGGIKKKLYKEIIQERKVPEGLRKVLDEIEVTVPQFVDYNNFRGTSSVSNLLSLIAYYKYQRYCHMYGLKLFLATGPTGIKDLQWINENIDNPTYERFLKYKRR